jgi:glutaredoxin 3
MTDVVHAQDRVTVYVTTYCPYCTAAKNFLQQLQVPYVTVDVTHDHDRRNWLVRTTGMRTVPQIFVRNTPVGGFTDMRDLDLRGGFRPLLHDAGILFKS